MGIISKDLAKGSTKYRIAQFLDYLSDRGLRFEFIRRDKVHKKIAFVKKYDLVFNQKCLIAPRISRKIFRLYPKVVFDFDDAIYTRPGNPFSLITRIKVRRRLHYWLRYSKLVMAPNEVLSNYARRYSSVVQTVPMALDLGVWTPARQKRSDIFTIGWAGAPVNIPLIERIDSVLEEITSKFSNVRVAIFSGRRPNLRIPFDYHPFQPGEEPKFIQSLDVGLLPLSNEEYTRGKSPIKSLQYFACGIPVVGNFYGASKEILTPDNSFNVNSHKEWVEALNCLISNPDLSEKMGMSGRTIVETRHDFNRIAPKILDLLTKLND
ncbi:MAG: glycosyltransferase family 4 protein [Desulfobacterales bacterium]